MGGGRGNSSEFLIARLCAERNQLMEHRCSVQFLLHFAEKLQEADGQPGPGSSEHILQRGNPAGL